MENLRRILDEFRHWDLGTWPTVLTPTTDRLSPLQRDCRAFVICKVEDIERLERDATNAWGLLAGTDALADIEWCCEDITRLPATKDQDERILRDFHRADWKRLYRNALSHFAAGMAAGYLHFSSASADLTALDAWLHRFAELPDHLRSFHPALGGLSWGRERLPERIEQVAALLPPSFPRLFALHTLHFLAGEPGIVAAPARRVKVHFPTFDDLFGTGGIYELELKLWEDGEAILVEDPTSALLPVASDFLAVVDRAFNRYQAQFTGSVSWCVRKVFTPRADGTHVRTLSGRSPTLAACVAFRALAEQEDVDPGCLMSAQFDLKNDRSWKGVNPELFAVSGEEQKAEAACLYGHFDRFLISNKSPLGKVSTEYTVGDGRKILFVRQKMLDDAYEDATGLIGGLRAYLDFAAGLLDSITPKYFGSRMLSGLYVEPEVFKDDIRVELERLPGGGESPDGSRGKEKIRFDAHDETDELRRYYTARGTISRVKWKDEWTRLRHAVVIGYPGDGKSVLARKLVRDLAELSRTQLERGQHPAAQLSLPILIRLEDVGREKTLEAAMRQQLPAGTAEVVKRHLDKVLLTDRACVILDGLDEVNPDHDAAVKGQLQRLATGKCRVILTSRPYRYRRADLPFTQLTEFKLAPLNTSQRRAFLDGWFRGVPEPAARHAVEQLWQGNHSLAEMTRNVLLLSLVCSVSETNDLDPNTTRRTQVYAVIVEQLYCGVWKETPTEEEDIATQVGVLRHVAWELFHANPAGWAFHSTDQWVPAIQRARNGMLQMSVATFRKGLRRSGLVVELGNGMEAFLHRTFLEYLAATHVATLSCPVSEVERFLWISNTSGGFEWQPAAMGMLSFLAGVMRHPDKLIERLLTEHGTRPDYFGTMALVAGRCLAECDSQSIPPSTTTRLANALENIWCDTRSDDSSLLPSFAHEAGIAVLTRHGIGARAIESLGKLGVPRTITLLISALRDTSKDCRCAAARALGEFASHEAMGPLRDALDDADGSVRAAVARALSELAADGAVERVSDTLRRAILAESWGAVNVAESLGRLDNDSAVEVLLSVPRDSMLTRMIVAEALGKLGNARAVDPLLTTLDAAVADYLKLDDAYRSHDRIDDLGAIAGALGMLGDTQAFEPLVVCHC